MIRYFFLITKMLVIYDLVLRKKIAKYRVSNKFVNDFEVQNNSLSLNAGQHYLYDHVHILKEILPAKF